MPLSTEPVPPVVPEPPLDHGGDAGSESASAAPTPEP